MELALIIGISLGLTTIIFSHVYKLLDEASFYGLILAAIGALYVGFTWSDTPSLIVNCIQCCLFGTVAYLGTKVSVYFLAAGFILHGVFDMIYGLFPLSKLIPPHYDFFCAAVDWVIGFYLLWIKYRQMKGIAEKA